MNIMIIFIVAALFSVIGMIVGGQLKRKFKKYSKISLSNGMSGAEIAAKMLQDHGISDVKITSVRGQLTDHYNPTNKTVNLSELVYNERNASAAAVAAHEVGHAVQHAKAYKWLGVRSKMVPVVNVSAKLLNFANIAMMFGAGALIFNGNPLGQNILLVLIAANVFLTFFALATLPVEFDASNRALAWMKDKNIVTTTEYAGSKDALNWAAMTYVVAALAALANLVVYLAMFLGNRD
jgi:Zn-dependent membrane protease YugP